MMSQIIGAGIPKTHTKLCPLECSDDPMFILLQSLLHQYTNLKDNIECMSTQYPPALQHENKGKLHLIPSEFIDWSTKLILFSTNHSSKKNLIKFRGSRIRVGIDQLKKENSILNSFKQLVLTVYKLKCIRLKDGDVENIYHLALTIFTFHACSCFS